MYADRFIDRLMKSVGLLGENPYIGRRRDHDLRKGLYSLPVEKYVIVYRIEGGDTVWILHVVHGSRDLLALLSPWTG
ncbi:MAG: type II toxin-antitoxin system RelE/ParE family toxin [Bryobacteraceae bacterium]